MSFNPPHHNAYQVLKLCNGLRWLSLDDNSIKSAGAEELAKSLQVNTNLHTLHLSCNRIDDAGCRRMAQVLL
jgi:Ran GTPase-activating protein (RanGAP) involved in mRNA processing and transport